METAGSGAGGAGRRWPRPGTWVLLAGGAGLLATTVARPFPFVPDDSLFYLVIGRNVAAGDGITFSGVMATNGFQPLWQGVVAAVVAVCRWLGVDGAASQLRAVVLVCWALLAVALVLADRLLRRGGIAPAARTVALGVPLVLLGGPYGTLATEANLVLLLLVAALLLAAPVRAPSPPPTVLRRSAVWGVVLGALLLARLDTAFVVACLGLAVSLTVARRDGVAAAARALVPAVGTATLVVAPYLAWNLATFDHLMPISGAVKLDAGHLGFTPSAVGADALAFLAGAAVCGAAALVRRRAPSPPAWWDWATVLAGASAASAFYLVSSPGRLTDGGWYHAPQILALALGVGLLADRVVRARPALAPVAVGGLAVVLVVAVGFVVVERARGANQAQADAVLRFSEGVGRRVPPGGVVATVDYPGYVALVGGRRVVALDGLTGDFRFQEDLVRDGAACTLARLGVTHLVTVADVRLRPVPGATDGARAQEVTSWLEDVGVGSLVVRPEDQRLADRGSGLTLWRVRPTCR